MVVDEASVLERMLRDLLADLDLLPVFELDVATEHGVGRDDARPSDAPPGDTAAQDDVPPADDAPPAGAQWRAPGIDDAGIDGEGIDGEQAPVPGGARPSQTTAPGPEVVALCAALEALAVQEPASLPETQALARCRSLLQATERMKALSVAGWARSARS